jgi:hypothetical protein
VKWENDECQNSRWCKFGAAVSASYVKHVLKRFYIPDEIQSMYTVTQNIDKHPETKQKKPNKHPDKKLNTLIV